MPWSTIERWDEAGRLVSEAYGWVDGPTPIVDSLLFEAQHTVNVEIEHDRYGRLLLAAKDHDVLAGWSDLEYRNHQLFGDARRVGQVEMCIGGQPTLLAGTELVSVVEAELAIREFFGDGPGTLGLIWIRR